jgi:hypothetical protein
MPLSGASTHLIPMPLKRYYLPSTPLTHPGRGSAAPESWGNWHTESTLYSEK